MYPRPTQGVFFDILPEVNWQRFLLLEHMEMTSKKRCGTFCLEGGSQKFEKWKLGPQHKLGFGFSRHRTFCWCRISRKFFRPVSGHLPMEFNIDSSPLKSYRNPKGTANVFQPGNLLNFGGVFFFLNVMTTKTLKKTPKSVWRRQNLS